MESDPIGLLSGLNTYGYAEGNPQYYIDSNGREFVVAEVAVAAVVVGAVIVAAMPEHQREQMTNSVLHGLEAITGYGGQASVIPFPGSKSKAKDEAGPNCPPSGDDPCRTAQAKLNVERINLKRFYTRASTPELGKRNYRAVVDNFNERVQRHNEECPSEYAVEKLPTFPQDVPPDER